MSRYPGTQFKVFDNSQATAIVPVASVNASDAVQYLTSFASVKGPEEIRLTNGQDFYDKYGSQDNVIFKDYGQPLFQASMNVNNGATLLAKRAVLDDATLGNATLAVVLTKYKEARITNDNDNGYPGLIKTIQFDADAETKYSLAPLVFSLNNSNNYTFATSQLDEYKERYELYKDYISDIIGNSDNPDNTFLSKMKDRTTDVHSGHSYSVYYNADNEVIDVNHMGRNDIRQIKSITTGLTPGSQKTYSSSFSVSDIIDDNGGAGVSITNMGSMCGVADKKYTLVKFEVKLDDDGKFISSGWTVAIQNPSYINVVKSGVSIDRFVTSMSELNSIPTEEWYSEGYLDIHNEYALVLSDVEVAGVEPKYVTDVKPMTEDMYLNLNGYTDVIKLCNDLMTARSGYIISEWVFPMFSIFDNGRGESTKSISIEYDAASSVTLRKAIYALTVYNYSTGKRLEKFNFSLNPYARNNNTGYTFDIESTVNYNSNQISVKTYYESYDAFLEVLQNILESRSDTLIETYDVLFGHLLNGKYPSFTSYMVSSLLKRYAYVYDYARLDIFDNDKISVNAYCEDENMLDVDSEVDVRYYYYNYVRAQQRILERLEFGSNGYCLDRIHDSVNPLTKVVPFLIIDEDSDIDRTYVQGKGYGERTSNIIEITGQPNGAIITDSDVNEEDANICNNGKVFSNFADVNIVVQPVDVYDADGNKVDDGNTYYIQPNNKTLAKENVWTVDDKTADEVKDIAQSLGRRVYYFSEGVKETKMQLVTVRIPLTPQKLYQVHYYRFFSGEFDRDIFNLDVYFPNACFDANYDNNVKLAIQRLAAYRGDFMAYMDMGLYKVRSYDDCADMIPSTLSGLNLTEETSDSAYVRDMHIAVTCLSYKIRNPYDNRIIAVTGTYGLSNLYIGHFANSVGNVFAGISNGITINNIIEGSVSYIPKIYPTSEMTSLNNIGMVYPSDDETIINEKQLMCDLRVNYGCYYDDRFSIETEYTMNGTESEFSYWNNVALVCLMMQAIRRACPAARYQFITADDLTVYQDAVENAMKPWKNRFAKVTFKYIQDDAALENKIFYAAIEVVFKPFAQAEIFELTALNYSTLSSTVTNI